MYMYSSDMILCASDYDRRVLHTKFGIDAHKTCNVSFLIRSAEFDRFVVYLPFILFVFT
jgi:hypothetical protein